VKLLAVNGHVLLAVPEAVNSMAVKLPVLLSVKQSANLLTKRQICFISLKLPVNARQPANKRVKKPVKVQNLARQPAK